MPTGRQQPQDLGRVVRGRLVDRLAGHVIPDLGGDWGDSPNTLERDRGTTLLGGVRRPLGWLRRTRCRFEEAGSDMPAGSGDSLLGTIGRVTVSIPANGPGEVLLPVRGGTEAFAAWSDEPIPRHSRVVVVDCISARSVLVTPY